MLFVNLTMIQELFRVPYIDGVCWSLLRELFFYAALASIFALGLRRHCNLIVVGLIALGLVIQFSGLYQAVYPLKIITALLLCYMHLFLVGIVLYQMRSGWQRKHAFYLAMCVLAAFLQYVQRKTFVSDFTAFLVLGTTIFVATQFPMPLLTRRAFVFLGTISYSLYLVHQHLGYTIISAGRQIGLNVNFSIALAITASFMLASTLTFLVERPANTYLRAKYKRWKESRPAAAPLVLPLPKLAVQSSNLPAEQTPLPQRRAA